MMRLRASNLWWKLGSFSQLNYNQNMWHLLQPTNFAKAIQKSNICNYSSVSRSSYINYYTLNARIPSLGYQHSGVLSSIKNFNTSQKQCIKEDNETKSLAVWRNLVHLKSSPLPALTLGLSGLIPFISAPAYMMATGVFSPEIAFAQVAYGACILSFLGGVRWGFTLPEESFEQPNWHNLGYSVVPSLVAWTGLLLPSPLSCVTLMGGLGVIAYFDATMQGYPLWFKALRFTLSFIAVLSLWTCFMCGFLLKSEIKNQSSSE
ncbi:unnamed protein product [Owenia fusiformis]|uniref:Transmembrane protein 69 n=1 Tax=Owenia fusiformis TaxID=6347 RepID=A0A8S4N0D8_OWEFU|nr:unnamed protein product [Owenia fusiformis]